MKKKILNKLAKLHEENSVFEYKGDYYTVTNGKPLKHKNHYYEIGYTVMQACVEEAIKKIEKDLLEGKFEK